MGFVYVLAGKDGTLRDGFPVQMNEIQARALGLGTASPPASPPPRLPLAHPSPPPRLPLACPSPVPPLHLLSARGSRARARPNPPRQAALVTADIDGDGFLEILAADAVGSVGAWGHRGASVWEVQTSGLCAQGVTLASLHGDGALQVVVPTTAGLVHVLDGRTGREQPPFPLRTEGQILAPALALPLVERAACRG